MFMDAIALFERLKKSYIKTDNEEEWKHLYSALLEIPDAPYTTFIKLGYFRERESCKNPVQRFQDIPSEYKISGSLSPVRLFISHKWETRDHPDVSRKTLERLLSLTQDCDDDAAIWLDYCSLPQRHSSGQEDRSPELKAFFKFQLSSIPLIILDSQSMFLWSDKAAHSGWCCIELLVAQALLQHLNKIIYTRKDEFNTPPLLMVQVDNTMLVETDLIRFDHKKFRKIYCSEIAAERHQELIEWMNVKLNDGSPTPYSQVINKVSPESILEMMSEFDLTFTNGSDRDVVANMLFKIYERLSADPFNSFKWNGKQDFFSMWHYVKGCLGSCIVPNVAYHF
jgi:hypothetical protein